MINKFRQGKKPLDKKNKGCDAESRKLRIVASFLICSLMLLFLLYVSINAGSVKLSLLELYRGLFLEFNPNVAIVYDLRFPRIIVALLAGAGLAVSGTLLQSVMKNPMTDPGIIGISSAAALMGSLVSLFMPKYYYLTPLFSVFGGLLAYFLLYTLAWDGGVKPVRLILTGVALNMTFVGIREAIRSLTGGNLTQVQSIIEGNVAQKTWDDVHILAIYVGVFLILSFFAIRPCNLLSLEDKTARSLGVNVNRDRFLIALLAIILASVTTAVVGVIGFVGLLVPHIGRILVSGDHKYLIPFSALLGAFMLLLSDTLGRIIAYPFEIQAAVIMAVVGGPFFILLLRAGGRNYGD